MQTIELQRVAPSATLQEAKERAKALRVDLGVLLGRLVDRDVCDVSTLEVSIKEVESKHDGYSFQDILNLLTPHFRTLMTKRVYDLYDLLRVERDIRRYLRMDEFLGRYPSPLQQRY